MKTDTIDLTRNGYLYAVDRQVKIDTTEDDDGNLKDEGKWLKFLTAIDFYSLVDLNGIDELNSIVDDICCGFTLQNLDYTPVRMGKDGRIIIRVEGEITNY